MKRSGIYFKKTLPVCLFSFFFIITGCISFMKNDEQAAILRFELGQSYLNKGNYPMALKELLEAERLDPNNPNVHAALGLVYFARERYEISEEHFLRSLKIKPDFTHTKKNLAATYIILDKFDKAEPLLKEVLKDLLYVDYHTAYFQYGLLEFKREKFKEALNHFNKAIAKTPNCSVLTYIGRTYTELRNYQKAVKHFENAYEACRTINSDEDIFYMAIAYYRDQQKARAIELFELSLKEYPNGQNSERARSMINIVKKELH